MYYPDQRYVTKMTTIRRECVLPEEALGSIQAQEGKRVDVRDIVAHGAIPARHVIIEGQHFFGLKQADGLSALMLVKVGEAVDEGVVLAGKNPKRGKRLFSPVRGIVTKVADGRIIMQEMPELIDLEAGVRGRIVEVYPGRGCAIETVGALIQGVWGNGRRVIGALRMEPEEGLESLGGGDRLDVQYRGAIMITRQPLQEISLMMAEEQNINGIIAPSMDARLRERALQSELTILLTEGFGTIRMGNVVYSVISEMDGKQAIVDAYTPSGWEPRRPEVIINLPADERPPGANFMMGLRPGMGVRITRAPYNGHAARILDLPKSPVLLDNGLRVPCARVELLNGEKAVIPLANIELTGR